MIYIDLLTPDLRAEPCTEVDNGNGTVSYKKANGKFLCLTPEGKTEERDSPGGPWESFKKTATTLVAEREFQHEQWAYLRPYVEVK